MQSGYSLEKLISSQIAPDRCLHIEQECCMMSQTIEVRTICHPLARSHKSKSGENQAWRLTLPLEDGTTLVVNVGEEGYRQLASMLANPVREEPSCER
jgi:hypothetical protein